VTPKKLIVFGACHYTASRFEPVTLIVGAYATGRTDALRRTGVARQYAEVRIDIDA